MYSSKEMADMTFSCDPTTNLSEFSRDLQVFNLLMALDGKRTVRTIAEQDTYELESLCEKIDKLLELQLIVPVGGSLTAISDQKMEVILSALSAFVGPMARALIEECAARMGHHVHQIPGAKINSLIHALSEFIQPQAKAEEFKEQMTVELAL